MACGQARGVPNSVLRGALFAAVQGKNRVAMKAELLAVQKGMEIRFTGWQLDQSDLDVWEQALHLALQRDALDGHRLGAAETVARQAAGAVASRFLR